MGPVHRLCLWLTIAGAVLQFCSCDPGPGFLHDLSDLVSGGVEQIQQIQRSEPSAAINDAVKSVSKSPTPLPLPMAEVRQIAGKVLANYGNHYHYFDWHDETTPMCNHRSESPLPNNSLPLCCLPPSELATGRPLSGSQIRENLPPWINMTLVRQGQAFAVKNRFSATLSAGYGLVVGLAAADARNVLAFTGASDRHDKALKRYIATAVQMFIWFEEAFSPKEEDNLILQSIVNVRSIHMRVARRANSAPKPITPPDKYADIPTDDVMWDAIRHDLEESPMVQYTNWPENYTRFDSSTLAVNQYMQGLTGSGFWGYLIMDPTSVFVWDATQEDLKSYLHLWAVILYMMGVEDEYNLSLQRTPREAAKYVVDVQNLYLIPEFFQMQKTTKVMMEALAIGLDMKFANFGLRRVMYVVLTTLFKVQAPHLRSIFSPAQELEQTNWDTAFVLSTETPFGRDRLNDATKFGIMSLRTGMFGPHFTSGQIVENVYTQAQ